VNRQVDPEYTLWPVPDLPYTILYWTMRRIQDATSATDVMDMPVRFVPALSAALAYQIALKRPEATGRLQILKADYEEQWKLASDEDRGREPARFVPWSSYP
jgi:methylthioribose-1-phosphate isomerase